MQFDDFVLGRCFQQLGAMSVFALVRKQAFPGIRLGRRFAETCPYAGSQQGNGQMSTEKVPPHVLGEAAAGLAEVAAEFADELGGPPTLAEFLELLGWAIPNNSDALDGTFATPLRF